MAALHLHTIDWNLTGTGGTEKEGGGWVFCHGNALLLAVDNQE